MDQHALLQTLLAGNDLTGNEMESCMTSIMNGEYSDIAIGAILALLQKKGVTAQELSGACRSMVDKAIKLDLGPAAVDTCGTGGDHSGTFNISTAAAFIACSAGAGIAKHGNRSMTSQCGSADVLEELGMTIDLPPELTAEMYRLTGFAFLFAPLYHPAMKTVAPVRKALGIRTIFNMLGPIANPANVKRQVIGVNTPELIDLYIDTLHENGCQHALVIHGKTENGAPMDEASLCGTTIITELLDGDIIRHVATPEEFGLSRCGIDELKGGSRKENANIIRAILDGSASRAQTEAVLYPAAMACYVAGIASCIDDGLSQVRDALESGTAHTHLTRIMSVNRELADHCRSKAN
ncbi:anthranilate phosphoribosyltransferase [Prosthecochloris vibrioformis]|uniref:Anthranilate phosphoribosyltransferase n=1 Tax=Prosthecochloris vibrioformis TaxID=1098 RepID=A0A5C4S370_PROVB|nr:anthranilate phosphoribosyltransferase [Prosthecochloris vibrioformis]TNJ37221.1 anthranilate phosphoribosyltransferase [Prosthecochloris vibrioformis]